MRNEHDAQDAVQDAFLRALRHYDAFAISDVRAWLLTIVRHCCFSSMAKQRGQVEYDDEIHGLADPAPNPEMRVIAGSIRDTIQAALDVLPPEFREVIILREIQNLSYKEISQIIGAPVGTVMSRLSRARHKLADALGGSSQAAG